MSGSEADNLSIIGDDIETIEENENVQQNTETDKATENPEETAAEDENKKEVKVKRARNPQPKLDTERLKGPRGLRMLQKHFEDVKFKGRGHEEEDLGVLMKNYEYWCHRLFPKFPLDDSLERMEKLGSKRPLQVYLKRIRLDMLLDDDITEQQQQGDIVADIEDNEDVFDNLLPQQTQTTNTGSTGLTDEQLERIRVNRERAQRVRQQMLIRTQFESSSQTSVVNNKTPAPSQHSTISNVLDNIDFAESMDAEGNTQVSTQNSDMGESFCFQTTAVVHAANDKPAVVTSPQETISVENADPNTLDDISVVPETFASQESAELLDTTESPKSSVSIENTVQNADPNTFDDISVVPETLGSQEAVELSDKTESQKSLVSSENNQNLIENMLVDDASHID